MAVWPYCEQQQKTKEFTRAFGRAVYCDGVDFGTDAGVKYVARNAGLDPDICLHHINEFSSNSSIDLNGDDSRLMSEPARSNGQVLTDAGLWGVPCLSNGSRFVWGAKRLWAIESAILADIGSKVTMNPDL